jgi:hypothetical protein
LVAATRTEDLKVVRFLVEAGADPNMWVDLDDYASPLLAAAYEGYEKVFDYLLPLVTDKGGIESIREELRRRAAGRKRREHMG